MGGALSRLRQAVKAVATLPWRAVRAGRYRYRLWRGQPAGDYRYVLRGSSSVLPIWVQLRLPASTVTAAEAGAFCARQTLPELEAVGLDPDGTTAWRVGAASRGEAASFFAAYGRLPDSYPAHLESCALVAAAEEVDAVVLRERIGPPLDPTRVTAASAFSPELRPFALFRAELFDHDPASDTVRPRSARYLVKLVDSTGVGEERRDKLTFSGWRRGPYLSSAALGARLEVGLRPVGPRGPQPRADDLPVVLVLTSFLARGGAEHTLLETLRVLSDRFQAVIVTLAPHRPERGDRRSDFEEVARRIISLGDLVHPAAMPGILSSLLDSTGAEIVYNANGTTLFYELGPRLKAERPSLRIIDHLYDHRIGYVDRYSPQLLDWLDACVAENHRIAETLVTERGWPAERVPVILPCGRPLDAFPPLAERPFVRHRLRRELGLADDDVVFLTAARMHPQKRPLDLVALARRVADLERVFFLMVGGGEAEAEVDAAVAGAGAARVRRLPFRADVPALVVAADVGCLVSEHEGLPVFLLECLQAGRPFLGTAVGEMGSLLRATGAGVVVERPGDLDGLEAAVRCLAEAAPRSALAARAEAAGADFTVEACAGRYADVFLGRAPQPHRWPGQSP